MTRTKRPDPRSIIRPFPGPGRLIEHAFHELHVASTGTTQQIEALGNLHDLPRPWDPPTCHSAGLRAELWAWLDQVVDWLNTEYTWDVAYVIPACWPAHPHLVHEIAGLASQRHSAGHALTSDALEEWHRSTLPAFTDRMRERLRTHCEEGHQPWPAQGRHARYSDPANASQRAQMYTVDVESIEN